MAAGACLLVSDHAPNVEVVGDAAATFPLAKGALGMVEPMAALMSSPQRRIELGARASVRATERYSWSRCAERYLAICAQVVARR
jgi:glycosyltransferase involved in cell wall biosynthesis